MSIKPLPGYVLVSPIEEEAKSQGGVYLPEVTQDKPMKGKVIAVGDIFPKGASGAETVYDIVTYDDYLIHFPPIQKGQTVIYKKYTNQEVEHKGKTYLLIKFDELLGVIE